MQSLQTMPRAEKANFLSMDFIERMIRVEQSISESFNKFVSLKQTTYYKNLSPQVKKDFDSYLIRKKNIKMGLYSLFFGSLMLTSFFNLDMTGNVIAENMGSSYSLANIIVLSIVGIMAVAFIFSSISKIRTDNRFKDKFSILEKFVIKKGLTKK